MERLNLSSMFLGKSLHSKLSQDSFLLKILLSLPDLFPIKTGFCDEPKDNGAIP